MKNSIEPRDGIYVEGSGFLFFAKNLGESLSNKYGQKVLDSAKKIYNRCNKNSIKKAIQKTAEATGDLIGNKFADKIISLSTEVHSTKNSTTELHSKELPNDETKEDTEKPAHKKRYISPEERQKIINELRLVPKKDAYF